MNCEICGTEIKGEPYKTKIDNSLMITCKECSRYGKVQRKPQPKVNKNIKKGNKNNMRNNSYNQRPANKSYTRKPDVEYEIVEDYGSIIRKAREEKNLTQKKLGEKIYERESVISHIESGKMIPEIKIARKLEKLLNIKIVEKVESDVQEFKDVGRYKEATIGDIARIKRK
ncbi:multiprotein bridging factor aMBF1 [Methanosphaera sp. BMS]|uniref:multiprotein bridging factor aMBF1 n=1 Tax=Methanosphaera sp. BMS TaxID=1789762 RepID=UPI000DC1E4AD|nr:multiprotein bridging factor aMBF1 [Methanosphaera sp. BMS]AWX33352.1 hypothetical protein AW729_09730 [Methanosphaera sp. BMS]